MKTFRLTNLGCKVNQYEGDCVAQMLEAAGLSRGASGRVDLVVVNTCTVTASAAAKSRKAIRAARRASPPAKLVVTGCMAEHDPAELAGMDEVDLVLPNSGKGRLLQALGLAGPELPQDELSLERPPERTRAFVRVQDGCEQRCSYCVLPETRGRERSRPPGAVLDELRRLGEAGVGEIVLCGIHLGRYGRALPARERADLTSLVRLALELPGTWRLRLSSIEIGEVTDGLAGMMTSGGRLARHLHLPMQSGSDRVLGGMRRPYARGEFLRRVERIRRIAGDIGFTTDVMVGFPGETDQDFADTLSAVRITWPHRVHRFAFSPRRGTRAERMSGRVDDATVSRRMRRLGALSDGLAEEFASSRMGSELEILGEPGRPAGSIEGYSSEYLRVRVEPAPPGGAAGSIGRMLRVVPERLEGSVLVGPA